MDINININNVTGEHRGVVESVAASTRFNFNVKPQQCSLFINLEYLS